MSKPHLFHSMCPHSKSKGLYYIGIVENIHVQETSLHGYILGYKHNRAIIYTVIRKQWTCVGKQGHHTVDRERDGKRDRAMWDHGWCLLGSP